MPEQFDSIWNKYQNHLSNYIFTKIGNREITNDILQDVALKLLQAKQRNTPIKNPQSWLFQVTRNTISDQFRKKGLDEKYYSKSELKEIEKTSTLCVCDFLGPLIKAYLPKDYAEPLYLSDIEKIPQKEIGIKLGLTISGAKSRVQRGRKMLKDLILNCVEVKYNDKGEVTDYSLKPTCNPSSQWVEVIKNTDL